MRMRISSYYRLLMAMVMSSSVDMYGGQEEYQGFLDPITL